MSIALDAPLNIREIEVQGAEGPLAARTYRAGLNTTKRDSLIVFFHGGGFVGGDLGECDDFLRCLVQSNPAHVVMSTNYTLATVRPFPAAVEDAHAVLVWAKKHKAKLGWTGQQMIVSGIEAGANLAAVCTLMSRDRGGPALAGQLLIMPMLDPGLSTCSMRAVPSCPDMSQVADACAAAYRGYLPNAADRSHPYASPLQSSRLKNLPPALILSAEDDPLRDEAEQYGVKLIACGIKTTVRRMPAAPLSDPDARSKCACRVHVLAEIASFVAGLTAGSGPEPAS
ncbi:alpha/beta hydrolase [Janthinobacterium agaricidamnosum]|uniref:Alpha/beta hydrolase fold family protein n=1 Tax=Janthinobacterium agaricidamnosum NBRC 102515 = DSM 9628 TaxID=1349767 RepID=W0V8F5_9BURK|nr:alpha/beta hydrolase [Janthinobacterium agaricidamnosum]CDG83542.1 alpha/beta hydrolase fold family protein [Janthinobacterium agaricidamnosum NBRC 102515 = DSM 9628]